VSVGVKIQVLSSRGGLIRKWGFEEVEISSFVYRPHRTICRPVIFEFCYLRKCFVVMVDVSERLFEGFGKFCFPCLVFHGHLGIVWV
jgi:hypothetical protein